MTDGTPLCLPNILGIVFIFSLNAVRYMVACKLCTTSIFALNVDSNKYCSYLFYLFGVISVNMIKPEHIDDNVIFIEFDRSL